MVASRSALQVSFPRTAVALLALAPAAASTVVLVVFVL